MGEPAARAFLQATAQLEICVAYEQDEQGAIVFSAPEIKATVVPLERLRRPRRGPAVDATKLASAASLAVLLAACTPHESERAAVIVSDPVEVAATPEVLIPAEQPPVADPERDARQVEEPCDPEPQAEPRVMPRKGKIKRTAGVLMRPSERAKLPNLDPLDGR